MGDVGSGGSGARGAAALLRRSQQLWGINTSKPGKNSSKAAHTGAGCRQGGAEQHEADREQGQPHAGGTRPSPASLLDPAQPPPPDPPGEHPTQQHRAIPSPSPDHKVNRRGFPGNCESCRTHVINALADAERKRKKKLTQLPQVSQVACPKFMSHF